MKNLIIFVSLLVFSSSRASIYQNCKKLNEDLGATRKKIQPFQGLQQFKEQFINPLENPNPKKVPEHDIAPLRDIDPVIQDLLDSSRARLRLDLHAGFVRGFLTATCIDLESTELPQNDEHFDLIQKNVEDYCQANHQAPYLLAVQNSTNAYIAGEIPEEE